MTKIQQYRPLLFVPPPSRCRPPTDHSGINLPSYRQEKPFSTEDQVRPYHEGVHHCHTNKAGEDTVTTRELYGRAARPPPSTRSLPHSPNHSGGDALSTGREGHWRKKHEYLAYCKDASFVSTIGQRGHVGKHTSDPGPSFHHSAPLSYCPRRTLRGRRA